MENRTFEPSKVSISTTDLKISHSFSKWQQSERHIAPANSFVLDLFSSKGSKSTVSQFDEPSGMIRSNYGELKNQQSHQSQPGRRAWRGSALPLVYGPHLDINYLAVCSSFPVFLPIFILSLIFLQIQLMEQVELDNDLGCLVVCPACQLYC